MARAASVGSVAYFNQLAGSDASLQPFAPCPPESNANDVLLELAAEPEALRRFVRCYALKSEAAYTAVLDALHTAVQNRKFPGRTRKATERALQKVDEAWSRVVAEQCSGGDDGRRSDEAQWFFHRPTVLEASERLKKAVNSLVGCKQIDFLRCILPDKQKMSSEQWAAAASEPVAYKLYRSNAEFVSFLDGFDSTAANFYVRMREGFAMLLSDELVIRAVGGMRAAEDMKKAFKLHMNDTKAIVARKTEKVAKRGAAKQRNILDRHRAEVKDVMSTLEKLIACYGAAHR